MTCIYNGCDKKGLYENFTLCRTHKNYYVLPDKNALPIPIYCKKCNNREEKLNCKNCLLIDNCTQQSHLCKKCDKCVCDIDNIKQNEFSFSYYTECKCFINCASCIYTIKCYE